MSLGDSFYTFESPGTITPVLTGVIGAHAKGVVAPTGNAAVCAESR